MVRALESVQAVIKAYDVRGLVGEQIDEAFDRLERMSIFGG